MSLKSVKTVFNKWKRNKDNNVTKISHGDCNDWLENFIVQKQITYYEYSDFKNFTLIKGNIVRANLKDNFFALKSFNNDDAALRKVVHEINLHKNIVHENILQFYGVTKIETDAIYQMNKYILVLEYADGGTLSAYLSEHFNELNWNDKYQLALQLASAVLCLHNNDISHKNMHADNILIHRKSIKLADFGLSKESDSFTTSQLFDILPYIDPKSFDLKNSYSFGKKSDVYSIGMLLWQISSGCPPFHAQNYNGALVLAILGGQREMIANRTPIGYSNLYEECWKLEPHERPDMQQVVSILEELKSSNKQKGIKDNVTEWVKNILDEKKIDFIHLNDLKYQGSLGEGAFGYIFKAIWTRTGNYVVYKRLINTTTIQYDATDAFIHELKIHLHLPNYSDRIIRCFGISQDDKTKEYLLVMQYADGGDLQRYLKNNKNLCWKDKKKLAFQIAEGLNYLHNENVLHRDLHSKNIVIHENNAKIIDFGISKIQDQKTEAHMRDRGITAYVDPKRLEDPSFPYTKSSDIYSFGVLMWEISSGRIPFKDNSYNEMDKAALNFSIINGVREKPVQNTPKEYKRLYIKCWDQEPEQRPPIGKVLEKFAKMGFGVHAVNVENSNESNSDLQVKT